MYLTDDERVILYDPSKLTYWDISDNPDFALQNLSTETYVTAMEALGLKPVIDI